MTALAIVIVAGALVAPATIASAAGGRCPAGARNAVITAFANVFSRASQLPADQRAASLAGADRPGVRAILDTWLASPVGGSTSVAVTDVRCPTVDRARADVELLLSATPLPHVLPEGRAVREDGTWKVATSTFCTRMILEDPDLSRSGACARP